MQETRDESSRDESKKCLSRKVDPLFRRSALRRKKLEERGGRGLLVVSAGELETSRKDLLAQKSKDLYMNNRSPITLSLDEIMYTKNEPRRAFDWVQGRESEYLRYACE